MKLSHSGFRHEQPPVFEQDSKKGMPLFSLTLAQVGLKIYTKVPQLEGLSYANPHHR
jgi:hypothetical protein